MKKLLLALMMLVGSTAWADYKLVVPSEPGSGGAVWAAVIAKHLEKHLGEPVTIQHIPGARNIPGFNEFHNKLRFEDKTIMVSLGSNAVNYLVTPVDFDFGQYDAIGLMNLDLFVAKRTDFDAKTQKLRFGAGNALVDGMAMGLMMCGPQKDRDSMLACWRDRVVWVNGVKGSEIRRNFLSGEFNVTRDPPTSWYKFYEKEPLARMWFTHGVYDFKTDREIENPNFVGFQFDDVYKKTWGVQPSGDVYEAYVLARRWNNVLQKVLWVNKGNPNTEKIRQAVRNMLKDPVAATEIERDSGRYQWIIGEEANQVAKNLFRQINERNLDTLVWWHEKAYNVRAVYKKELVKK
jgi:hypothetical protein